MSVLTQIVSNRARWGKHHKVSILRHQHLVSYIHFVFAIAVAVVIYLYITRGPEAFSFLLK